MNDFEEYQSNPEWWKSSTLRNCYFRNEFQAFDNTANRFIGDLYSIPHNLLL
jgi:hypothetical protein